METDNSPQAKFVKNLLRKDHPHLTEEQIEAMWQEMEKKRKESEDGGDNCIACSG